MLSAMTALLLHTLFVFAVLGTKVILALWVIYYLFPSGKACPECDAETYSIERSASRRFWGAVLFLGRVRLRWCPECSWEGWARRGPSQASRLHPARLEAPADRPGSLH
jgi:hypothetical protein